MDLWIYGVLFICGLALYVYAYRQGQKDERKVVQAWLDKVGVSKLTVRSGGEWKQVSPYEVDREGLR